MTYPKRQIYRKRRPVRAIVIVLLIALLAAAIFYIGVFFGFRKYIVYTTDGLRVEVPWLQDEPADTDTPSA